jgi:hypothetical protein
MKIQTVVIAQDTAAPILEQLFRRQWPGVWPCGSSMVGNTLFVPPSCDGKLRADWLICCTPPPEKIVTDIPKNRRIFLIQEPPEFWRPPAELLSHFGYIISPYHLDVPEGTTLFLGVTTGLFWWYGVEMNGHKPVGGSLSYDEIRLEPRHKKGRLLSTIVSNKSFLPGQQSRVDFTLALKEQLGSVFDIFGYPHNPIVDKRDALIGYKFHLAIENAVHPHYWTEKLADPILGRCKVFYHGAGEIHNYFPQDAVVSINIHEPQEAMRIIKHHLSQADKINDQAIEVSREHVLSKFNIPFYFDKIIQRILESEQKSSDLNYSRDKSD